MICSVLAQTDSAAADGSGVGIDRRGVDDDVEPPNASTAARSAAAIVSRDVRSSAAPCPSPGRELRGLALGLLGAGDVLVGDHDVRAALGDLERDLAADAAAAADDDATLRLNSLSGGIRCSLASSSAQYSMRNASVRGSAT